MGVVVPRAPLFKFAEITTDENYLFPMRDVIIEQSPGKSVTFQFTIHYLAGVHVLRSKHLILRYGINLVNNEAKMAAKVVLSLLFLGLILGQETKKEPIVLSDSTFEHLTQASTGATTGDWLVLL